MIKLKRTDSKDADFVKLVTQLDADLAKRDGDDHAFYHQFNSIDALHHVVVISSDEIPVACGALKSFDATAMEIKRMFVQPDSRGKGLATEILKQLELWAAELGYINCILETGKRQQEAIALYTKNGYFTVANYGQYQSIANSLCFRKNISD